MTQYHRIDPTRKPTEEQIEMLKEAEKRPIVYDEDCPELSKEELLSFPRVSKPGSEQTEKPVFHTVQSVLPKDNYILSVLFTDGITKEYDVKPLFEKWEIFDDLRTVKGLFAQVKVDIGGFGISWNDDIDLSCNELWINGKEIPNEETMKAFAEVEGMIKTGTWEHFSGNTEELFRTILNGE